MPGGPLPWPGEAAAVSAWRDRMSPFESRGPGKTAGTGEHTGWRPPGIAPAAAPAGGTVGRVERLCLRTGGRAEAARGQTAIKTSEALAPPRSKRKKNPTPEKNKTRRRNFPPDTGSAEPRIIQSRRVARGPNRGCSGAFWEPLRASKTGTWKGAQRYMPGKNTNQTTASAKARCGLSGGQRGPRARRRPRAAQSPTAGTAPPHPRRCRGSLRVLHPTGLWKSLASHILL